MPEPPCFPTAPNVTVHLNSSKKAPTIPQKSIFGPWVVFYTNCYLREGCLAGIGMFLRIHGNPVQDQFRSKTPSLRIIFLGFAMKCSRLPGMHDLERRKFQRNHMLIPFSSIHLTAASSAHSMVFLVICNGKVWLKGIRGKMKAFFVILAIIIWTATSSFWEFRRGSKEYVEILFSQKSLPECLTWLKQWKRYWKIACGLSLYCRPDA